MQAPNLRFPKSFQQLLQPLNLSCHRWGQQASRIRFQHLGARLRSGVIAHRPLVSPLPLPNASPAHPAAPPPSTLLLIGPCGC